MTYDASRALHLLRIGSGHENASFRPGQEEAIRAIVSDRRRLLVVQKTGWGKSFVYFIAVRLLRASGHGPALLVSPLLSLMRNQIAAATRMGIRAAAIHSDNYDHWTEIEAQVVDGDIDMLLISPERLANARFRDHVLSKIAARISLLVVDEAHCISDWGHDFRPQYRLLERIIRDLPANLRLLATTATANNRVMDDLLSVLGPDLTVSRGDLNRPSLALQTIQLPGQAERLAWLADQLPKMPGSGIVYTLTVRDTTQVTDWLRSRGIDALAYSGQTGERRPELEQALLDNQVKVLVATTALGMGFDKPDLAFVIHYQAPGSVVAYYQQVGRAGRALDAAYGILLSGKEDKEIHDYFINQAFPTETEVAMVFEALERHPDGLSEPALESYVNLSRTRIKKTLDLLALESPAPIVKQGANWQLTAARLSQGFWDRTQRLTAMRRAEQQQMQAYVGLQHGHMAYLIRALDGQPGNEQPPTLPKLPEQVDAGLVREAIAFLRRTSLPIAPRRKWPAGGMPAFGIRGSISAENIAQEGRALSVWGDAGWGDLVRQGKYRDQHFANDLIVACVELVQAWQPRPAPAWVTCIPSLRHPELVPDFARRLAQALGLPFHAALHKTAERPEQKTMANSAQQARNLDGTIAIPNPLPATLRGRPVLLVDDMVDSRWTMTVAAWLLSRHGSGAVWPLALALTGHDNS
jgi:ATP-dependent DNA helicase RecQ